MNTEQVTVDYVIKEIRRIITHEVWSDLYDLADTLEVYGIAPVVPKTEIAEPLSMNHENWIARQEAIEALEPQAQEADYYIILDRHGNIERTMSETPNEYEIKLVNERGGKVIKTYTAPQTQAQEAVGFIKPLALEGLTCGAFSSINIRVSCKSDDKKDVAIYTAQPPSQDLQALIGELADLRECHQNLLDSDNAQVQALIAEIDGLERIDFDEGGCYYPCSDGDNYRFDDVRAVLNKYRGAK